MARCRCSGSDLLVLNPAVEARFQVLEGQVAALQAEDVAIQSDIATLPSTLPAGVVARRLKPTTEGGFANTEFAISGLSFAVPNRPIRGTHQVQYGVRAVPTTLPSTSNSIVAVSLRANSASGTLVDSHIYPFPTSTVYGSSLVGVFTPSGMTPGQTYVLTMNTDGTGIMQIVVNSWTALLEMGLV